MMGRIVASYEADPSSQQEILQEAALSLWQALPSFRGEGSLKAYVARITQNRCITHVGRAVRAPMVQTLETAGPLRDVSLTAEEKLVQAEKQAQLLAGVRALPLSLKQVVTLALEGMSYAEIAAALGISENNVAVRFNRAKGILVETIKTSRSAGGGAHDR